MLEIQGTIWRDPLLCLCCFLALFTHPISQLTSPRAQVAGRSKWPRSKQNLWASPLPQASKATAASCPHVPIFLAVIASDILWMLSTYHSKSFIIWLQLTFMPFLHPLPYALQTCQFCCTFSVIPPAFLPLCLMLTSKTPAALTLLIALFPSPW